MLINYLKMAVREIVKYKLFTVIKIFGLALAILVSILYFHG
jgi:hypothetical protein